MSLRSLCLLASLVLSAPLLASTHTWLGTSSERISDPRNWSGGSPVGDAEATLVFPSDAARFAVTNDVAGLRFQTLTFEDSRYVLSGELMMASDATLNGGFNNAKFACPLQIEGTLTVWGGNGFIGFDLAGPIGGSGGILFDGSWVTMSGNASNTYGGTTVMKGARLFLNKSGGAIAIPGEIRSEPTGSSNRLTIQAPEQIADIATVRWPEDTGNILLDADETIGTLEAGTMTVFSNAEPLPTFTIAKLVVKGILDFRSNLRLQQSVLEIPANRSIACLDGRVSVPAEGITLRGPGRVLWRGNYTAPTRVDGPESDLFVANSDVTVTAGFFSGEAKSIVATGGTLLTAVTSVSSIRLGPGARVRTPQMRLNGTLDLGGAMLVTDSSHLDPRPRVIIENTSTEPVTGTFAGIEENGIAENRYRVSYRGGSGNDVTIEDLQKPAATIALTQLQTPGFVDEPVAFEVVVTGSGAVPTGSIAVSQGFALEPSLTVPLIAGRATFSLTFDKLGDAHVYVDYSGDSVYASSKREGSSANLTYRKPVLTSIDPSSAPAGSPVTVTLRGSDFHPRSRVSGAPAVNVVFVSSSELRATLDLSYVTPNVTMHVVVVAPEGNVFSDPVDFHVTAEDGPLMFDDRGAIARVTAGAKTVWIRTLSNTQQAIYTATDEDRNGIVRWDPPGAVLPTAAWGVVDMTTGDFVIRGNNGLRPEVLPFPADSFTRDAQGNASRFVVRLGDFSLNAWRMLWVRPGVGAWLHTVADAVDADKLENDILFGSIDAMIPLAGSPPHPAGFAQGDVLLMFPLVSSSLSAQVYAARLTAQDLEDGPGVLEVGKRAWSVSERDSVVKLPVLRIGGGAGSVSVRYTTVERTALDGVHFHSTSGTLTFGPGELIQSIEIPLVDDQVYRGYHIFNVELSDPVTATLGEETAFVVGILDDDPAPVITIDGAAERYIVETDAPQVVTIALTLTGVTTVPVTVRWQGDSGLPNRSGEVTFAPGETRKNVSIVIPANDYADGYSREFLIDFAGGWNVSPRFVRIVVRDDEAPFVSANDVTVDEDAGTAQVTLSIPAARTEPFFVSYSTSDATAVAPADYTSASGSVVFNPGVTQATIAIPIVDDAVAEGDKSLDLELTEFGGYPTFERSTIPVVIVDDELTARPAVSIEDAEVTEPEGGLASAALTLRFSAASSRTVTVHYQTIDGSAAGGLDYQWTAAAVVFAPGETVKTVALSVFGDLMPEGKETFAVKLGSAMNATLLDGSAVVTIVDNDKGRRRAVGK
ncbi:MAG TPA: Calx-beta domain-containing protein [Thermoanaerobaculia bacterium]|nr:Calx-beta domain-containing protein [Thermoanaerobaculia bacterium]